LQVSFEPGQTAEARESYLFSVVDLPDDGLPTSPIRGSRGMECGRRGRSQGNGKEDGHGKAMVWSMRSLAAFYALSLSLSSI
jgi:hypothetical protein